MSFSFVVSSARSLEAKLKSISDPHSAYLRNCLVWPHGRRELGRYIGYYICKHKTAELGLPDRTYSLENPRPKWEILENCPGDLVTDMRLSQLSLEEP